MDLDILIICKNNQYYFQYIFPNLLNKLEKNCSHIYIYENNSHDKTKIILKELARKYEKIKIFCENVKTVPNRYYNIIEARNRLVTLYLSQKKKLDTYVLWLDTNIVFSSYTIPKLLEQSRKNPSGVMFTCFTYYNYESITENKYYYDILAYNYGKFFKTIHSPNLSFKKMLVDNNLPESNTLLKVDTAFGGLVLLKTSILKQIKWEMIKPVSVVNPLISSNIICEHWLFCEKVKIVKYI